MESDIFFSICQTEVHGTMPSERKIAESHLSTEVQKMNPGAVIPTGTTDGVDSLPTPISVELKVIAST